MQFVTLDEKGQKTKTGSVKSKFYGLSLSGGSYVWVVKEDERGRVP